VERGLKPALYFFAGLSGTAEAVPVLDKSLATENHQDCCMSHSGASSHFAHFSI
jgi:hypothetical protein